MPDRTPKKNLSASVFVDATLPLITMYFIFCQYASVTWNGTWMATMLLRTTYILWKQILKFWNPMMNLTVWDHTEVLQLSPYCFLLKEKKNNMAVITHDSCCVQTPPK